MTPTASTHPDRAEAQVLWPQSLKADSDLPTEHGGPKKKMDRMTDSCAAENQSVFLFPETGSFGKKS